MYRQGLEEKSKPLRGMDSLEMHNPWIIMAFNLGIEVKCSSKSTLLSILGICSQEMYSLRHRCLRFENSLNNQLR